MICRTSTSVWCDRQARPPAATAASSAAAANAERRPWRRSAARIIARPPIGRLRPRSSTRNRSHSQSVGSDRADRRAFESARQSSNVNLSRPAAVSRRRRRSHSRTEGMRYSWASPYRTAEASAADRIADEPPGPPAPPASSATVMSRSSGPSRPISSSNSAGDSVRPDWRRSSSSVGAAPRIGESPAGSRPASTRAAAPACRRQRADAASPSNVSSKNRTPSPSAPPPDRRDAGTQSRALNISANSAIRTGETPPPTESRATASSRNCSCAAEGRPSGSRPYARPNSPSTRPAWARSNRSTAVAFSPDCSGTSRNRISRLSGSQNSSRTSSTAFSRRPSHCRSAAATSDRDGGGPAASHCSAWSMTSVTAASPPRTAAASSGSDIPADAPPPAVASAAQIDSAVRPHRASANTTPAVGESRGSTPARTSDDLPQPEGP